MAKKKQPEKSKSSRAMIYAGIVLLVVAGLAIFLSTNPNTEKLPSAGDYSKLNMPGTGEPGKVKMMVFMKFDCPHCYDLDKSLPQLLNKYGDKISVTYVPIVWPDKQSTKSIEAYILAGQMGKGDEMREAMFQAMFVKQMDVMESIPDIENVATGIGLGTDFNIKLEGGEAKTAAQENLKLMSRYYVTGTPTVIINGNLNAKPAIENLDTIVNSLLG